MLLSWSGQLPDTKKGLQPTNRSTQMAQKSSVDELIDSKSQLEKERTSTRLQQKLKLV